MGILKLNLNAINVKEHFDQIKDELERGNLYGFEILSLIKIFEKNFNNVKDLAIEMAIKEIGDDKNFQVHGVKMEAQNGRTTYNFEGSEKWKRLKDELKVLEAQLKVGEVVCQETGEVQPQALKGSTKETIKTKVL